MPRSDFSYYLLQKKLGSCSDKAAGSGDKMGQGGRRGKKIYCTKIEVGAGDERSLVPLLFSFIGSVLFNDLWTHPPSKVCETNFVQ